MNIITGPGYIISCLETEAQCPICTAKFDVGAKMEKTINPVFKMKCPKCKGKITVSTPFFSSDTMRVWETECPKNVKRQETETPFKVNGK